MENQEWHPGNLLQLSGSFWQTCTLHAAVMLDLFTIIGEDSLTAETIAERTGTNARGMKMLLNALTAMKLLIKKQDVYVNSFSGKTFLSAGSEKYIGYMIKHHHHLVESWANLDQAVRTGRAIRPDSFSSEEEQREAFIMGMFNTAMNQAPELVDTIDLTGRKRLLDLGGGPGTYAIQFCLKHPDLKASVFDLPTTRPFAQKVIDRFHMSGRIDFIEGDFLKNKIPGGYDVIWLSHILHGEDPESCAKLIQKAVSALEPAGMIIIHEFILDNTMDGPLFPALFSLNMLARTDGGQSYTEDELMTMLKKAGIQKIQRTPYCGPTESGIIAGERFES